MDSFNKGVTAVLVFLAFVATFAAGTAANQHHYVEAVIGLLFAATFSLVVFIAINGGIRELEDHINEHHEHHDSAQKLLNDMANLQLRPRPDAFAFGSKVASNPKAGNIQDIKVRTAGNRKPTTGPTDVAKKKRETPKQKQTREAYNAKRRAQRAEKNKFSIPKQKLTNISSTGKRSAKKVE